MLTDYIMFQKKMFFQAKPQFKININCSLISNDHYILQLQIAFKLHSFLGNNKDSNYLKSSLIVFLSMNITSLFFLQAFMLKLFEVETWRSVFFYKHLCWSCLKSKVEDLLWKEMFIFWYFFLFQMQSTLFDSSKSIYFLVGE